MLFGMLLTGASSAVGVSNPACWSSLSSTDLEKALAVLTHVRAKKGLLSSVRATLHEPVFETEGRGGLDFWLTYLKNDSCLLTLC